MPSVRKAGNAAKPSSRVRVRRRRRPPGHPQTSGRSDGRRGFPRAIRAYPGFWRGDDPRTPWRISAADPVPCQSVARGEWPWGNPYVFSGQPQIADPQSMLFSPPFVLLALVNADPSLWAVDVTVLAVMALGGIGVIVYFHDRRWHWAGALVAALVFPFGAAMAWRLQHFGQVLSLAYLPWALVFLDRAITRLSLLYGALSGLVAAFIVLGRDQVALLAIYMLAAYALWLLAREGAPLRALRRAFWPLAAGAVVTAALVMLPILMTALSLRDRTGPKSLTGPAAARLSSAPAQPRHARCVRRLGSHGRVLGPRASRGHTSSSTSRRTSARCMSAHYRWCWSRSGCFRAASGITRSASSRSRWR